MRWGKALEPDGPQCRVDMHSDIYLVALDYEAFRLRLVGDRGANLGNLTPLAQELELSEPEKLSLAVVYVFEREPSEEGGATGAEPERIARPEEVIEDVRDQIAQDVPMPSAMKCGVGSRSDLGQYPRDATTWDQPEGKWRVAMCEEHKRFYDLSHETSRWETALYVIEDWQKMAKAWSHYDLEQMVAHILEDMREEYVKAQARYELAREVANAPLKGNDQPTHYPRAARGDPPADSPRRPSPRRLHRHRGRDG
jgi:hypothetical protein